MDTAGLPRLECLVLNVGRSHKDRAEERRHGAALSLPACEGGDQHAVAHRMRKNVDVLQAGPASGCGLAPFHELAEQTCKGEAADLRRRLIVPVVEQQPMGQVARPDQRDDHGQLRRRLIA